MCIRQNLLTNVSASVLLLAASGCSSNLERMGNADQFYTNSTAPQQSYAAPQQQYPGDTNLGPVNQQPIQNAPISAPVQNGSLQNAPLQAAPNNQRYAQPQVATNEVQSQTMQRIEPVKQKVVDTGNQLDETRAATVKPLDHSVNAGSKVQYQAPSTAGQQLAPATTPSQPAQNTQVASLPEAPAVTSQSAQASVGSFRWPAQGRVIAKFGQKVNGAANEGIDISLPEGTPVKAAEGGTVIYSGSDVEGFGNLVIVRHADNWVSAYAHASQVFVKRGQTIRRGQTIAKSGRTGNATTPKLHFELRRKSTPVDPLRHLG